MFFGAVSQAGTAGSASFLLALRLGQECRAAGPRALKVGQSPTALPRHDGLVGPIGINQWIRPGLRSADRSYD